MIRGLEKQLLLQYRHRKKTVCNTTLEFLRYGIERKKGCHFTT